ncbi:hypothetical protein L7F22_012226 [Adiantum nelumboides]|nr:hypothetical protein [Adiantum nelumboides]
MQDIFRPYLDDFVLVFFDDILIYFKDKADHEEHVCKVLEILHQHQLYAKESKCTFCSPQVSYLGFIISADGISIDPKKIKDIVEWPQPSSVSKVCGFLGITGWYKIFVKDYALIAAPLTCLLKKGMRIDWKAEHEASFIELKGYLVSSPILKLPDFNREFEVVTDASGLKLVYHLRKSLYGLKQAPSEWYKTSHQFMLSQGYMRSEIDHCLYTLQAKDGSLIILILYVDDMLLAGRQMAKISALKSKMAKVFDMKDMGEASHILGMHIQQDRSNKMIYLSPEEYIDKVLQCFNMDREKALMTPLPSYVKLSNQDCPQSEVEKTKMDKVPYTSACGNLMYAMIATRLDIAFIVGVVSKYMSNPSKKHWEAVKGIMRYIKHTKSMHICYGS